MEDAKIIDLFFSRSEQAVSETKLKYDKLCMKIAGGILGRPEDAEECVNTSYFKLWNAIPPKKPDSLRGYLCKTVRNTALNYEKKELPTVELDEIIPSGRTVEQDLDVSLIREYINEFLKKSEKKNRGVFILRYYFNMSVKEIAENTGMGEHAVTLRLARMRKRLREYLTERGIEA